MSTAVRDEGDKKSGKGLSHGMVSEVSAFFKIKEGHTDAMIEACRRFNEKLRNGSPEMIQSFGLTDMRHVVFDNGTRLAWMTSFESDWKPYINDSVNTMGLETWFDWFQHCEECPDNFLDFNNDELRKFIQAAQQPAAGLFRSNADLTLAQVRKGQRLQKAFDQLLDQPDAEAALAQPVLKPLLDEAAD